MSLIKTIFTYFWQVLLAGASLFAIYMGVGGINRVWWLMSVPMLMAAYSILLVRRHDLDLSKYFAKRLILTIIDAAIIIVVVAILVFFLYLALIPLFIMLYMNVRSFIEKCDDFHTCLALTLADPLHFCISIILVLYFSELFY